MKRNWRGSPRRSRPSETWRSRASTSPDALDNVDRRPEALTHHRRAMELDRIPSSRRRRTIDRRSSTLQSPIQRLRSPSSVSIRTSRRRPNSSNAALCFGVASSRPILGTSRRANGWSTDSRLLAQYQRRRGELAVTRSVLLEAIDIQNAVLQLTGDNVRPPATGVRVVSHGPARGGDVTLRRRPARPCSAPSGISAKRPSICRRFSKSRWTRSKSAWRSAADRRLGCYFNVAVSVTLARISISPATTGVCA